MLSLSYRQVLILGEMSMNNMTKIAAMCLPGLMASVSQAADVITGGYMSRVDVSTVKQAIAKGERSTNPLAWCRMSAWFMEQIEPLADYPDEWVGDQPWFDRSHC
jgi:hypothetical protein